MMLKVIFLISYLILADAQLLVTPRVDYADNAQPTPYQFSYTAPAEGGSSSHQESGDGNGRVQGSYTIDDEDGRSRVVEYVADEDGFRASISTNEPGTANQNPADVSIASSADDGREGTQVLEAPVAAVTPVAPPAPIPRARLSPVAVPRRPALIPIQPALIPIQPSLVPIQPTLLPPPPAYIPPRRFVTEPAVFPFGAGRFVPRPTLIQFDSRRAVAQPTLIPIAEAPVAQPALIPIAESPIFSDPFFRRNFFRPLERDIIY